MHRLNQHGFRWAEQGICIYIVSGLPEALKEKDMRQSCLNMRSTIQKIRGKAGYVTLHQKRKAVFVGKELFYSLRIFSADSVGEYELLSFSWYGTQPHFNDCVRSMEIDTNIFTVYYSPECPYVLNSIKELEEYASDSGIPFKAVKIDSLEKAKSVPCVFNNWANFKNGKFISNTILNKNSFEKLLNK